MSQLYEETHRAFQDEHGTRALADRLESLARSEFSEDDRAFIQNASFFFLSTVDGHGRPTVSYKGGAPGFVRIVATSELIFPVYDGNGMFLTLGNIAQTAQVGMLFIDFESPRRLRLQGVARVVPRDAHFPGAQHLVRVTASQVFVNCGRYIHKLSTRRLSPHVPDAAGKQPFPTWKRIDILAEVLPAADQVKVTEAGGIMTAEQYPGEDPECGTDSRIAGSEPGP